MNKPQRECPYCGKLLEPTEICHTVKDLSDEDLKEQILFLQRDIEDPINIDNLHKLYQDLHIHQDEVRSRVIKFLLERG